MKQKNNKKDDQQAYYQMLVSKEEMKNLDEKARLASAELERRRDLRKKKILKKRLEGE